ncbi:MAG: hypothetical protein BGO31_04460 [Bacteroidetes bacterium 43-16]|nr:MAG: hypothetical protein BGO31_04460 [Bacteroidetes bacterium 43-16]
MKSFIQNFFVKPPVIFPLVACFLIFLGIYEASQSLFSDQVEGIYKIRPILMILMAIFWTGATFFQKWGALGFVILTIVSLMVYFYSDSLELKALFGNILMLHVPVMEGKSVPIPLSAIFSFIALFFYRRMN